MRRPGFRETKELQQVRSINKKMVATAGTVVAALPVLVPAAIEAGGAIAALGRTAIQSGRAVATEISSLGIKNAVLANPVVATEAVVATAAAVTETDVGIGSQTRKAASNVAETVSDALASSVNKVKVGVTVEAKGTTRASSADGLKLPRIFQGLDIFSPQIKFSVVPEGRKLVANRVRVQAQGAGLEKSVDLSGDVPPTVNQGIDGLSNLKAQLTKSQLKARKKAFEKAEKFIRDCGECGGLDAQVSKTFKGEGKGGVRVDIEIIKGKGFVPDE